MDTKPRGFKTGGLFVTGAGIGGTEGLLYGFGAGEEGERLDESIEQGLFGAVTGGGMNMLLQPLTYGYQRLIAGLKDESTETIGSLF